VFLKRHFKKNVKSHVFSKSEKNEKYVFSNTAYKQWCRQDLVPGGE